MPLRMGGGAAAQTRTARVTTGAIAGGGSANVTVNFAAFSDTNFTVSAEVEELTAGDSLRIRKVLSRTASSVTVLVANQDTLNARTGTVHILAIHD